MEDELQGFEDLRSWEGFLEERLFTTLWSQQEAAPVGKVVDGMGLGAERGPTGKLTRKNQLWALETLLRGWHLLQMPGP